MNKQYVAKMRRLETLRFRDYNPNEMTQGEFENLKASLARYGPVVPVVVNMAGKRKNYVVGGEHRIRAALELGWTEFPCFEVKLSLEAERNMSLVLQRHGHDNVEKLRAFTEAELISAGYTFSEVNSIFTEKVKLKSGPALDAMEAQPYEHWDYVVLMFRNRLDWTAAVEQLGLKRVKVNETANNKIGLGRIVDGKKLLERIGLSKGHSQPKPIGRDYDPPTFEEANAGRAGARTSRIRKGRRAKR